MEVDSGRYTCRHSGYHVPVNVSVFVTVIQPGKLSLKTVFLSLKITCTFYNIVCAMLMLTFHFFKILL